MTLGTRRETERGRRSASWSRSVEWSPRARCSPAPSRPRSPGRSSRRRAGGAQRTRGSSAMTRPKEPLQLSASNDALLPGDYSFWFGQGTGHARVGQIVSRTPATVTRTVIAVDHGDLSAARAGRFTGWYYVSPEELDVPFEDVRVQTSLGNAPAWLIPSADLRVGSDPESPSDRWVIQVHGRATVRQEALRAIPVFRAAGYTSLLISYRNDGEAPQSPDHRYALGDIEWLDVESRHALRARARRAVGGPDGLVDGRRHGAAGRHPLPRRVGGPRRGARLARDQLGRHPSLPGRGDVTPRPGEVGDPGPDQQAVGSPVHRAAQAHRPRTARLRPSCGRAGGSGADPAQRRRRLRAARTDRGSWRRPVPTSSPSCRSRPPDTPSSGTTTATSGTHPSRSGSPTSTTRPPISPVE